MDVYAGTPQPYGQPTNFASTSQKWHKIPVFGADGSFELKHFRVVFVAQEFNTTHCHIVLRQTKSPVRQFLPNIFWNHGALLCPCLPHDLFKQNQLPTHSNFSQNCWGKQQVQLGQSISHSLTFEIFQPPLVAKLRNPNLLEKHDT